MSYEGFRPAPGSPLYDEEVPFSPATRGDLRKLELNLPDENPFDGWDWQSHKEEAEKILALVDEEYATNSGSMAPADRVMSLILWAQVHARLAALKHEAKSIALATANGNRTEIGEDDDRP